MQVKKVVITGGTRGIGLSIVKKFLNDDCKIVIIAKDFSDFKLSDKKEVQQVRFDLKRVRQIPNLVKKIGHADILINNAAIFKALTYKKYTEDSKKETLSVNIEAPVALIQEFAKGMIKKGHGRIVNVASIAGQIGHTDIWYAISKAGLINVTKSFAKTLAPKGIVINAVAPGPVLTDMFKRIPKKRKLELKKSTYLSRYATPEEIAETVYWLATTAPDYINGFCIDINNGSFPR